MASEVAERARQVRENVLSILEISEAARNDDRVLLVQYWARYDQITFDPTFPVQFVEKATSPESITRARRSIQKAGLHLPTDESVVTRRRQRQQEMRDHFASNA